MTTLNKLKAGQSAKILKLSCREEKLRRHFLDMGLTPKTTVSFVKTAPLGDPIEIKVRGYKLTLRLADAAQIEVGEVSKTVPAVVNCNPNKEDICTRKGEKSELQMKSCGEIIPESQNIRLALIGNQNSGKTTLFNRLTGANCHVGNFPGVTVERSDGMIKGFNNVSITDLPGIYSLSTYSSEEVVTRDFLLKEKPDAIINIVDASNLERNLFLTTQLLGLNIPMVVALNMMDEVNLNGGVIDLNGLEQSLGAPVVAISAAKNEGIDELLDHVVNVARYREVPDKIDVCGYCGHDDGAVHRCIHAINHLIEPHTQKVGVPAKFAAAKLVEGDELVNKALDLSKDERKVIENIIAQMEKESGLDRQSAIADMRFAFIEQICRRYVYKPEENRERRRSEKLDKILTGKFTALPVFVLLMALVFYISFGPIGTWCSDMLEALIEMFGEGVRHGLENYRMNPVVTSLMVDGVIAGVGSVLSFLPIIVILFFLLSMLEDSGYMARVAFVMDKLLRKVGLSGRSFVPMLIGFGCSVPAIMAARTLPSERDRKMTIFLTPFMSCSAKLPIYVLLTAAFFAEHQTIVIISLYALGILVGLLLALLLKTFFFRGEAVPFVMELPDYRLPELKNVWHLIYFKAKYFITKAFTIIFAATVIIWFLQTFDIRLNVVPSSEQSIISFIGRLITPIFVPLGIDDWRVSTAFLTGFAAKESVVSTLSVLLGGDVAQIKTLLTPLSGFAFLVFSLLYTPCVAAIATVKKELGAGSAVLIILVQCTVAWLVAFSVFSLGNLMF